jgi:ubiquinone biosynthesis protein COQ4
MPELHVTRAARRQGPAPSHDDPDEADAVHAILHGSRVDRARVALGALRCLVRDPNDTQKIFVLAVALDRDHIPAALTRFLSEPGGLELLRDMPALDSSTLDLDALGRCAPGTLGHAYAAHLREGELDTDIFRAPPGLPLAIAYFAQRFRQCHDVWHVLTGYAPDVRGEVLLQAFTHGQLGTPAPRLAAVVGALQWARVHPALPLEAYRAYRRGKAAKFLLAVRWEDLWNEPLDGLRARLDIGGLVDLGGSRRVSA